MCTTDINFDLMINAGVPLGLKQEAHLWWTRDRSRVNWEQFIHCQVRASATYSGANRQFGVRNMDVLVNAPAVLSHVVVHS